MREGHAVQGRHRLSFKLGRPNFYLIEWQEPVQTFYTNKGVVWSSGAGDFLDMRTGNGKAQKQRDMKAALSSAAGISGGSSATIPKTFFSMVPGSQLTLVDQAGVTKQADGKVGEVDCYVFAGELKGRKRTIWIGKQDFLIHQVRNVITAAAMKAMLADAAKRHPEIAAHMPKTEYTDSTSTETHQNIVLNQKLSPSDFAR